MWPGPCYEPRWLSCAGGSESFHRMKKHGFHCLFSLSVGCTLASGCPGWKERLPPSWAHSGSAEADLCFTKGLKLKNRNDFRGAAGAIALPSKEGVWSEPMAEVPWLMPAEPCRD